MSPESLQPELSHTCAHPCCCSHEATEAEAASGPEAGTFSVPPGIKGLALWDSLKRYALWSLAFFGIYASSSVCVF
ncbi:MAG: hypothetical protein C4567_15495 [Deltaproteobacteria bacterium]|nr:MAG: hypothetical protein C4567_15495 [Deltaproteobacteria bacterium]